MEPRNARGRKVGQDYFCWLVPSEACVACVHVCVCVCDEAWERVATQTGQSWAYGASALGQQVFFRVCSLRLCLIFPYFLALQQQRPVGAARPTADAQMGERCCQEQTCSLKCHKRDFFFFQHVFMISTVLV